MRSKATFSWVFPIIGVFVITVSIAAAPKPEIFADASRRPDFLMILVDDLGYGDLSSYCATDLWPPNIDGLVASGIRFDSFYANCAS